MHPKNSGQTTLVPSGRKNRKTESELPKPYVTVYKNGVLVREDDMYGSHYMTFKNGSATRHRLHGYRSNKNQGGIGDYIGHGGNGKTRRYLNVSKGDVIRIEFNEPIVYRGGFVDIDFAKEIIIGNGISFIGKSAFSSSFYEDGTKIFVGKNVEEVEDYGLKNYEDRANRPTIYIPPTNKKIQLEDGSSINFEDLSPFSRKNIL
jgi:hypothetical protein